MTTHIPDLTFDVVESGEIIELRQSNGSGEYERVDLHKIHVRMLAERIGILEEQCESELLAHNSQLIKDALPDLHSGMKWLFEYLDGVPCFPPGSEETDDVIQARWVLKQVEMVCRLAGVVVDQDDEPKAREKQPPETNCNPVQQSLV